MLWPQSYGAGIRGLAGQSHGFIPVCNLDFFPLEKRFVEKVADKEESWCLSNSCPSRGLDHEER